jgi:hypothetical protein
LPVLRDALREDVSCWVVTIVCIFTFCVYAALKYIYTPRGTYSHLGKRALAGSIYPLAAFPTVSPWKEKIRCMAFTWKNRKTGYELFARSYNQGSSHVLKNINNFLLHVYAWVSLSFVWFMRQRVSIGGHAFHFLYHILGNGVCTTSPCHGVYTTFFRWSIYHILTIEVYTKIWQLSIYHYF